MSNTTNPPPIPEDELKVSIILPREDSNKEISEAVGIIQLCTVRYKVRIDMRYKAKTYDEGVWVCGVMGKKFSNARFSEAVRFAVEFIYNAHEYKTKKA